MWRKFSPFIIALLMISTGFLGWEYFGKKSEVQDRDRQIVSLIQASCDIETLMQNDSVQAYLVDVLGDSVFANQVTDVRVDTIYRDVIVHDTIVDYQDRIVYRDRVVKEPTERYFMVKSNNTFKGTQAEFEMYRDSMNIYKHQMFSLRAAYDSLMYQHGLTKSELMTKDIMQAEFDEQLADMQIELDSTKSLLADKKAIKDSLENELLRVFNDKKYRKQKRKEARREKRNGPAFGASIGGGLSATLGDGEVIIGPSVGIQIGGVLPIHRQN